MSSIDLNSIGREIFKQNYNVNKLDLSFAELKWYEDDCSYKFRLSSDNITEAHCRDAEDFILCLKNLLEYCYISNIDINKYIQLKINENIERVCE